MRIGAHFKGSNLKESGDGDVYVLTYNVRKSAVTMEDLQELHCMQGGAVTLVMTNPERDDYDDVMEEKHRRQAAQRQLDLDAAEETIEPETDEPELVFGLFEPQMVKSAPDYLDSADGGVRYHVSSEQVGIGDKIKTYFGYYSTCGETTARVDGAEQFETLEAAEEGLAKWAAERDYQAVTPVDCSPIYKAFDASSGFYFVQSGDVSSCVVELLNDEIRNMTMTRSARSQAEADLGEYAEKCGLKLLCYVSDEWEGFRVAEAVDVSNDESEDTCDKMCGECEEEGCMTVVVGSNDSPAIPQLTSYLRPGDTIIRLEEKRKSDTAANPIRLDGPTHDNSGWTHGGDDSFFLTNDVLDEQYRLVLCPATVQLGDAFYYPASGRFTSYEVDDLDETGVIFKAVKGASSVDWPAFDKHYRMFKRS